MNGLTEEKLEGVPHDEWLPADRHPIEPPLMRWSLGPGDLVLALGDTTDPRCDGELVNREVEGTNTVETYRIGDHLVHVESDRAEAQPHGGRFRMKIEERGG